MNCHSFSFVKNILKKTLSVIYCNNTEWSEIFIVVKRRSSFVSSIFFYKLNKSKKMKPRYFRNFSARIDCVILSTLHCCPVVAFLVIQCTVPVQYGIMSLIGCCLLRKIESNLVPKRGLKDKMLSKLNLLLKVSIVLFVLYIFQVAFVFLCNCIKNQNKENFSVFMVKLFIFIYFFIELGISKTQVQKWFHFQEGVFILCK